MRNKFLKKLIKKTDDVTEKQKSSPVFSVSVVPSISHQETDNNY